MKIGFYSQNFTVLKIIGFILKMNLIVGGCTREKLYDKLKSLGEKKSLFTKNLILRTIVF